MPRKLFETELPVINQAQTRIASTNYLEIATTNPNKLVEFRRILPDYEIIGRKLDIEEIQSCDPYKVVRHKAIEAYKANGYTPILVEETSVEMYGLGGRPGPYIKDCPVNFEPIGGNPVAQPSGRGVSLCERIG